MRALPPPARLAALALALAFVASAVPQTAATAAAFGSFGTFSKLGDADNAAILQDLPTDQIPYLGWTQGTTSCTHPCSTDDYYIHFDADPPTATQPQKNDIRIAGTSPGTILTATVAKTMTLVDIDGSTAVHAADSVDNYLGH